MDEIKKKILIVEDDKDFSWILKQSFENQDLVVLCAEDGQEGLAMAEKENPDLIIVDIMLPKINGIEMTKKIKENGSKAQIIFLTNSNDTDYIRQAVETVSETDYIIKADIPVDKIIARVKEKLGIK